MVRATIDSASLQGRAKIADMTALLHPRRLWSRDDTEIFSLAVPALGSLAAGPLYVLVDTAIVGHLGELPLAGLGLAAVLLDGVLALSNFLAYATTALVGRNHAAGRVALASTLARQAMWLAALLGMSVVALGLTLGAPMLDLLGGGGAVPDAAYSYLRLAVFGLPFALIALAGQGYLRGTGDLKTPLLFIAAGNLLNVALDVLFIIVLGWGLPGSAAATAIAQATMGAGFILKLVKDTGGVGLPSLAAMRPLLGMSGQILGRTSALYGTLVVASSVLAHVGSSSLAAHHIIFQLWVFLALVLDSIAIAGQVMVSRKLGAGDGAAAVVAARRMIGWSVLSGAVFAAVLMALGGPLPQVFTQDASVLARVAAAWPIFALMQPCNGAVFALDGILIGAGDSRYLMRSMAVAAAVSVPLVLLAYASGGGITEVWLALSVLIFMRLATIGARFRSGKWVVTGS